MAIVSHSDGDLIQKALKASIPAEILGVKRFSHDRIAVVAMRAKDQPTPGLAKIELRDLTFGWKFEVLNDKLDHKYLHEKDLLDYFPEHVSEESKTKIAAEKVVVKKRDAKNRARQNRLTKWVEKNPDQYFGMFTIRGNKTVCKIVESTALGKDPEETYQSVMDQIENSEAPDMEEAMDTDVRSHVWERIVQRHGAKLSRTDPYWTH